MVRGIELRPWSGWGLNSFSSVYSIFQPASLVQPFDKGHNTYLELIFEIGIPAGLAVLVGIGWLAVQCLKGFQRRHRDREFPALALAATVLVGIHALVDFSIQIPAVGVTYAALLGTGWAQSWSSRSNPK